MVRTAAYSFGILCLAICQTFGAWAEGGLRQPAHPDGQGDIYGTSWGMTLALDGSGFYNEVLGTVLDAMDSPKAYQPLPYKRAKVSFQDIAGSCLYPSDIGHLVTGKEIEGPDGFIQTVPLIWVESHIFSRYGEAPLASLEALEGRKIAYPNGSALPTVLEGYGASFLPTTTETAKARMLIAGRVDHMSGSLPDNIFVFKSLGRPLPPYNPDLALIRVGVSVVCHDTPENRAFVGAFDGVTARLVGSGVMADVFAGAGVDVRFMPKP
ncbi:hypothetical protein ACFO5Q_04835 [Kordiimonas lipolytica]|uniref:Solute-binding protein family 3/N-terminal domain-containing protein n=1 Tax=Kordiimonas lipolytica TaxID=1662421 RepID=A0ABV8U7I5_9PROT|nr:hypothetical protein [Kordiimonas lipolytica]